MEKNNHKIVHSRERQLVHNVFTWVKNGPNCPPTKDAIMKAVSEATGVSLRTVYRIVKEHSPGQPFRSPRKHLNKPKVRSTVDDFDEEVIRRLIYNFTTTHGRRATMRAVYEAALEAGVQFTGKLDSFRRLVHRLGFRWRKTRDNRHILIEKSEIRAQRAEFIRSVKRYRAEGRNIVYNDESYLHEAHTMPMSWDDGSKHCSTAPIGKGRRLIMVHAGGALGFVPGALLIFKSGSKSGDYHDDMNHQNHMTWVQERLLPNLPSKSVLVIDNASYHNVQVEKHPTSNSRKADMQAWLTARGLEWGDTETRPLLYRKILLHKPRYKRYVLDELLAKHGHAVLRLPPYHPELNPIELIWANVKNHVAATNTTFKLDDVWKLAEARFNSIGVEEWQRVVNHAIEREDTYMTREAIIDNVEELVIHVGEDDSDFSDIEPDTSYDDMEVEMDAAGPSAL